MTEERPVTFRCRGETLLGIFHPGAADSRTVLVMVVGGPQYRVGSHRMFVDLARRVAAAGTPVFRFDCRGMGDSDGEFPTFEALTDDLRSAIDAALDECGSPDTKVVLFGLCDGASACAMYGADDARVAGLVLLNPWVRSEGGEARAQIQHYYGKRILQAEFWRRLHGGQVGVADAVRSVSSRLWRLLRPPAQPPGYVERMLDGIERHRGKLLVVLSEDDLVAQEFQGLMRSSRPWADAMRRPKTQTIEIVDADHTLSREGQIDDLGNRLSAWLGADTNSYGQARVRGRQV